MTRYHRVILDSCAFGAAALAPRLASPSRSCVESICRRLHPGQIACLSGQHVFATLCFAAFLFSKISLFYASFGFQTLLYTLTRPGLLFIYTCHAGPRVALAPNLCCSMYSLRRFSCRFTPAVLLASNVVKLGPSSASSASSPQFRACSSPSAHPKPCASARSGGNWTRHAG